MSGRGRRSMSARGSSGSRGAQRTLQANIREAISKLTDHGSDMPPGASQKRRRTQRSGSAPLGSPSDTARASAADLGAPQSADTARDLEPGGPADGLPAEGRGNGSVSSDIRDGPRGAPELSKTEFRVMMRDELRSVIRDELSSIVRAELEEMKRDLTAEIERSVRGALDAITQRVTDIEKHIRDRDDQLEEVQRLSDACAVRLDVFHDALDDLHAESRLPTLVLTGDVIPPPLARTDSGGRSQPEDVLPVVINVVQQTLPEVKLQKEDIASCFRVGNKKRLVVKFNACGPYTARDRLYQGRFQLMKERDPKKRLYISESLSPRRQTIFKTLLDAKKDGKVHSIFTRDGVPCFRPVANAAVVRVDRVSKLQGYVPIPDWSRA